MDFLAALLNEFFAIWPYSKVYANSWNRIKP